MINPIDGSMMVFAEKPVTKRHATAAENGEATKHKNANLAPEPQELTAVTMWGELFKYINRLPRSASRGTGSILRE